ncbi:MAG TPA: hypothetical protein VMW08_13185 [Acidimicrobiales bacterium]|nr:hypothetical protein [Acidimicrobiales bacterium]
MRPLVVALLAPLFVVLAAGPAAAQEDENRGSVEVGYDIGPYDGSAGDWPIAVVEVRGDLEAGDDFTVELTGDAGTIWTATVPYRSPVTRVEVDEFVGVGELTRVTISQASEIVTIIEIPDEIDEPTSQVEAETETTVADVPPPTALPDDVDRGVDPPLRDPGNPPPEVLGGGSGRDSGQLALSVIVSLVVLVLVFRTPLPAASTQRWRS